MERDFWILMVEQRAEPMPAEADAEHPFYEMSHLHTYESVLPVFSEEKASSFAQHVAEQHAGKVPTPIRLTPREIQERPFRGDPHGHCVVDPTPDLPSRVTTVGGLYNG